VAGQRLSDSALVRSCLRGDAAAWNVLVDRYARLTYAVPTVLGCAPEVAGEITLTVFRSLAEHLPTLGQRSALDAWLVEAAREACLRVDESLGAASSAEAFAPLAARLESHQRVRQGVATLSAECPKTLAMLFGGPTKVTRSEVAQQLGLTESQVLARRAACLRRLLDELAATESPQEASDVEGVAPAADACRVPFEDLVAYAEGELHGDALEQLAAHLRDGCPTCCADLRSLEQLLGLMHTDRSTHPPQDVLVSIKSLWRTGHKLQSSQWIPLPQRTVPVRQVLGWLIAVVAVAALAVGAVGAYAYWPKQRTGSVVEMLQGGVRVKLGQGAPWTAARAGQLIGQGSRLEGSSSAIALVRFWDDSLLRIESDGEWAIRRLQGSRNRRTVRLTIYQAGGKASYASAPPTPDAPASVQIELDAVTLELVGTATVNVLGDGSVEARIHQGNARAQLGDQVIALAAGQALTVQADGTYVTH